MEMPLDLQNRVVEVLQEDNTIVFVMRRDGQYLSLLGGTNKDLYADGSVLIGKSYPEVLKKEKAEYFQSLLDRVVESGEILETEYDLEPSEFLEQLKDGPQGVQRFRVALFPLEKDKEGRWHKVVWVVHNITAD